MASHGCIRCFVRPCLLVSVLPKNLFSLVGTSYIAPRCFTPPCRLPSLVHELSFIDLALAMRVGCNTDGTGRKAMVFVRELLHLSCACELMTLYRIVNIREHGLYFVNFGQWWHPFGWRLRQLHHGINHHVHGVPHKDNIVLVLVF
jgi:hypothetical protein